MTSVIKGIVGIVLQAKPKMLEHKIVCSCKGKRITPSNASLPAIPFSNHLKIRSQKKINELSFQCNYFPF